MTVATVRKGLNLAAVERGMVIRTAARTGLFLVVLVMAQLVLWAGVTWAEYLSRPQDMAQRSSVVYSLRLADGSLTTQAQAHRDGTDGYVVSADATYSGQDVKAIIYRLPFQVTDPAQPLALYLSIREQIGEIRVNGDLVQPQLALNKVQGIANSEPGLYLLPQRALKPGDNTITIEQAHFGYAFALPEYSIGPAEALGHTYRWKTFFMVDLATGGIFILVFSSLLIVMIDWPAGDRDRARSLVAFLMSSALVTYVFSFNPPFDLPLNVIVCLLILAGLANSLFALDYVRCDMGLPSAWSRRLWQMGALLAALVAVGLFVGVIRTDLSVQLTYLMFDLSHYILAAFCGTAALGLGWAMVWRRPSRWAERLVVMICLMTFALDHIGSLIDLNSPFVPTLPLTLYLSPMVGVLLGLAMLMSIAQQAGEARKVVATANETLATTLTAREAELRAGHERQQALMQRQARLEERQRIVRDMHDGIGGQLLGLMLQVRGGRMGNKAVETSLQTAIDDLRLIVDSLDSAEEGLGVALRAFEYRARPQIEAAGLKFVTELALTDQDGLHPGPRASLQVLRILQEAVSNALRHARARQLTLRAWIDAGLLHLSLQDDGCGFTDTGKGGRGLTHMRSRARRLGGQIQIAPGASGTQISFTVPVDVINRLDADEVGL